MNNNDVIISQVQRLGELRGQRTRIEAQEEELIRAVRGQMAEHGVNCVCSDDYEAKLVAQERLTVDPAAFKRAVTAKDFLAAASISVTAAREILGDRKLRKISQVNEAFQLRVTPRVRQAVQPEDARQGYGENR